MSDNNYSTELEDLEFTRSIRKRAVGMIVGEKIPVTDSEQMKILTTLLTDLDRASIGRMKIKSDDKGNNAVANSQALIAEFLTKVVPQNIKHANSGLTRSAPTLGSDIPDPLLVPGETAIGTTNSTYDEFSKKHFPTNDEA